MDGNQAGGRQLQNPFSFWEKFIARNFTRMPRWVQICVYLLFAIVVANGLISPVYIEGRIWVNKKPAPEWGDSFVLTMDGGQYIANKSGLWVVRTFDKIPGKIRVDLQTSDGTVLKPVYIPIMPLPIYSAFKPPFVDITYEPGNGSVRVGTL